MKYYSPDSTAPSFNPPASLSKLKYFESAPYSSLLNFIQFEKDDYAGHVLSSLNTQKTAFQRLQTQAFSSLLQLSQSILPSSL